MQLSTYRYTYYAVEAVYGRSESGLLLCGNFWYLRTSDQASIFFEMLQNVKRELIMFRTMHPAHEDSLKQLYSLVQHW